MLRQPLISAVVIYSSLHHHSAQCEERRKLEEVLMHEPSGSAVHMWKFVLSSVYDFSTSSLDRHGFFESNIAWNDPENGLVGVHRQFDHSPGSTRFLLFDRENLPVQLAINSHGFFLNQDSQWELESSTQWAFILDETDFQVFGEECDKIRKEGGGYFRFEPGLHLAEIHRRSAKQPAWHQAMLSLADLQMGNKELVIGFRTPHDQRRYGTILREVRIQNGSQASRTFRNHIIGRESPLRINVPLADLLAGRLNAIRVERGCRRFFVKNQADREAAMRLCRELTSLETTDNRAADNSNSTRFGEMLLGLSTTAHVKILPQFERERSFHGTEEFVSEVVAESEMASQQVQQALTRGDADAIVDDPNILWLGLERATSPYIAAVSFETLVRRLGRTDRMDLSARMQICRAFGELGPPAWAARGVPDLNGNVFLEAILHSRWQWVPTDDELAVCRDKLTHPWASELEKFAAVDCLLRWGLIDDAPPDLLNDWFMDQLRASEARRHATWKALTRTQSGRKFLNARFDQLAAHPEVQQLVAQMFRCRAEATLALKRYDFMTEEECRQTLARWQPVSGEER